MKNTSRAILRYPCIPLRWYPEPCFLLGLISGPFYLVFSGGQQYACSSPNLTSSLHSALFLVDHVKLVFHSHHTDLGHMPTSEPWLWCGDILCVTDLGLVTGSLLGSLCTLYCCARPFSFFRGLCTCRSPIFVLSDDTCLSSGLTFLTSSLPSHMYTFMTVCSSPWWYFLFVISYFISFD